jgi:folate-binding protein YgfZ
MTHLAPTALHRLDRFGTLTVAGPEARAYLQGQLSFDLDRLGRERIELATCNSPQGRVQAVIWLIERSDGIVLLLPSSMLERTLARLRKYILRAKVQIDAGTDRFLVCGAYESLGLEPRGHREADGRSVIQWPGQRHGQERDNVARVLCIAESTADVRIDPVFENEWRRADITAGLPQVYPQTHEAFVAQMLNVDLLGGIGFEKGCYTGQEIIARTHYRGAIKRRMFRFRANGAPPEPGTRIVIGDHHAGDVVDAVATADGCELLAVVTLSQIEAPLEIDSTREKLERLGLPYAV